MAEKKKYEKKITPKVTLQYPKIFEPDYGTKDFPKVDGEFTTRMIFDLSDPAHQQFLDGLKQFHEAAISKGREEFEKLKVDVRKKLKDITINDLYTTIYDKDTEKPTGKVYIKATQRYRFKDKKASEREGKDVFKFFDRPSVFDAFKRPVKKTDIWSGTQAKVAIEFDPEGYFIPGTGACGLSFKLKAVQIVELVGPGGGRSADSYGFDEEEDGFSADGMTDSSETGADNDGADAGDTPDF